MVCLISSKAAHCGTAETRRAWRDLHSWATAAPCRFLRLDTPHAGYRLYLLMPGDRNQECFTKEATPTDSPASKISNSRNTIDLPPAMPTGATSPLANNQLQADQHGHDLEDALDPAVALQDGKVRTGITPEQ